MFLKEMMLMISRKQTLKVTMVQGGIQMKNGRVENETLIENLRTCGWIEPFLMKLILNVCNFYLDFRLYIISG